LQPDTLIPGVDSPQSWNRYSYVENRPILFNDPSGHDSVCGGSNQDPDCENPSDDPVVINNPDPLEDGLKQDRPKVYDYTPSESASTTSSGSLILDGGLGVVGAVYSYIAASVLKYKTIGKNILISGGSRYLRSIAGFNPYTNRIGAGNLARLFSIKGGFQSGYASTLTWAGVAVNILSDINNYANGTYDGSDFAAAILVDTVTTVGFAAVAGAVSGAVSGAVAGAVGGTIVVPGVGTVSGAVVGAVAGAVAGLAVGVSLSYGFNSYEVSNGQTLRDASISTISSGIDSLFHP
jgi:outer membrane lipoprotein SlyB